VYYVNFPLDPVGNGEPIYRRIPIDMINNRYGRIKTEDKAVREFDKYRGYKPFAPLYREFNEREEYLYDVIDIATGYVLTRTFRGKCREFIDLIIDIGFYFCGEEKADIDILTYNQYRKEHRLVGVYACGMKTIRSYRKLTIIKED
jgi:hypothetical protein